MGIFKGLLRVPSYDGLFPHPVKSNKKDAAYYSGYIMKLRQYLNLSLAAFGEPLGYSGTHISRFEKNVTKPSQEIVDKICRVYNVNPKYFNGEIKLEDAVKPVSREEHNRLVGERIEAVRVKRNMSIKVLSQQSGVSESFIYSVEKGEYLLTRHTAEKLAIALEVGVEWLLTGDEEKKEYPVDGKMTEWLWKHPEIRKELWNRMKKDDG